MTCNYWWWMIYAVTTTTAYKIGDCEINIFEVFINCVSRDGSKTVNCTRGSLPGPFENTLTETLETLSLVDCCLNEIKYDMFAKTIHLRHLDLRYNFLKNLGPKTFQNTKELQFLDISNNRLLYLSYDAFEQTSQLDYLDLSNNSLQILDYRTFRRPSKLSTLKLDHNNIHSLDYAVFSGKFRLTKLYLSHNSLDLLDHRLFNDTRNLKYLDLSHNRLEILDNRVFSALGELTSLLLNYNSLSVLDSHLFDALTRLEYLNLGNNKMKSIANGLFASLANLRILSLRGNAISTIDKDRLRSIRSLQELDISDNPLVCDCEFYRRIMWSNKVDVTCSEALNYTAEGCHVSSREDEIVTETLKVALVTGIGVTLVLLFLTFCVSICLWKRYKHGRRRVPGIEAKPKNVVPPRTVGEETEIYDDIGPYYHEIQESTVQKNQSYLSDVNNSRNAKADIVYDYAYQGGQKIAPSNKPNQ